MVDVNDRGTLTALAIFGLVFWPVTLTLAIGWLVFETIRTWDEE